jgi:hypothetical protein
MDMINVLVNYLQKFQPDNIFGKNISKIATSSAVDEASQMVHKKVIITSYFIIAQELWG